MPPPLNAKLETSIASLLLRKPLKEDSKNSDAKCRIINFSRMSLHTY